MLTYAERVNNAARCLAAIDKARSILKPGDRLRVAKCPGTKRTITFKCWDGRDSCWMVSQAGIDDYHPVTIDRINGTPIDIACGFEQRIEEAKTVVAQQDDRRKQRERKLQHLRNNAHVLF